MFRFPVVSCVLEWRRICDNSLHKKEVGIDGELVCFRRHKKAWYGDHTRDICMSFCCEKRTTMNKFYIKMLAEDKCSIFQSSDQSDLLRAWVWSDIFVGKLYKIHAAMRRFQNSWRRRQRVREVERSLSMLPEDIVEKLCGMI